MARNRSGSQYLSSIGKKSSPAAVHSPRSGLISGPNSNQLHSSPVAVSVSPSGERTICHIDDVKSSISSTNPFANEHKDFAGFESMSETLIQKYSSKKRSQLQMRRKKQNKERRAAKIIFTQRNSAKPIPQIVRKSVSVQTDLTITWAHRLPQSIGDAAKPKAECNELTLSKRKHREPGYTNKDLASIDNFFARFMPENLRILTSFMVMIILIFGLTSIILDVEVPSDFFRMATNYVQSFKYQKPPQTTAEKCLDFLTNLFK